MFLYFCEMWCWNPGTGTPGQEPLHSPTAVDSLHSFHSPLVQMFLFQMELPFHRAQFGIVDVKIYKSFGPLNILGIYIPLVESVSSE